RETDRGAGLQCLESNQMREGSFAGQAVEHANVGSESARGEDVIGDVRAVGRLIRGRAGDRQQLAESRSAIREASAKGADADGERRRKRFEADALPVGKGPGRERSGAADRAARQRREPVEVENVEADALPIYVTGLRLRGYRRGDRTDRLYEQIGQTGNPEHGADGRRGVHDVEPAADPSKLLVKLHEHADSGGTEKADFRAIEPDAVMSLANS